jgi:hypothetical protein
MRACFCGFHLEISCLVNGVRKKDIGRAKARVQHSLISGGRDGSICRSENHSCWGLYGKLLPPAPPLKRSPLYESVASISSMCACVPFGKMCLCYYLHNFSVQFVEKFFFLILE